MKKINPDEPVTLLGSTFGSTHPDFMGKFKLHEAIRIIVEEWPRLMQYTACILREGRPIYTKSEIMSVYDAFYPNKKQ